MNRPVVGLMRGPSVDSGVQIQTRRIVKGKADKKVHNFLGGILKVCFVHLGLATSQMFVKTP